jgi:hypothetical protein
MAINIVDTRSCRYKVGCLVKSDVAGGANALAMALSVGPSTGSHRLFYWVLKCVGVPVEDYFVAGTLVDTYIYIEDPIQRAAMEMLSGLLYFYLRTSSGKAESAGRPDCCDAS